MTELATTNLTEATDLEAAFLAGLEEAQGAYERIVATQAWTALGFDSFAAWWDERVAPTMRALSMKPTREIAAAVIEQVRQEEAALPPTQRRTQRELGEMVGVSGDTVARQLGARSPQGAPAPRADLDDAVPQIPAVIPAPGNQAPAELPGQQDLADALAARIAEAIALSAEPPRIPEPAAPSTRDRDDQTSREVASRNLAKSVWTLAGFASTVEAAALMAKDWQPSQDIYPKPTTAARMRLAADYLHALAERWPA